MSTPILHGYYRSSTSYRTRIALALKHIEYDSVEVPLDQGAQRAAPFLEISPMGAVPVLQIDGHTLIQSPAILEYLDEHYPEPLLLPATTPARQQVREIAALIGCDIHPINNLRVLKYLRATHGFGDTDLANWYRHWIAQGFDALENLLSKSSESGRYCVGDAVTLADVYLLPQVYNAARFEQPMTPYPNIQRIAAHCAALPAFAAAHPDRHEVTD